MHSTTAQPVERAPPSVAVDLLAQAWLLKDACYTAWTSDPVLVAASASTLRALADADASRALPLTARQELAALASWTEGIAELTQGRMAPACDRLEHAATLFKGLDRDGPATETLVPRIMALSLLGRHAEAAECGERAQRAFLAQGDRRSASKVSLNLGSLNMRRDAYAEAAWHYRSAAVLFARVGDAEHSVMADIGLGDALVALGELAEAQRIFARAGMRADRHGLPVLQAMVDESRALLDLACGRFGDALEGLERSRGRYEALGMPQHLAIAEKQLGDAYLELRLWPEALTLLNAASASMDRLDMPDDQAWALLQRGRALARLGRIAAAGASFLDAAELFKRQANAVGAAAVSLARAELALADADGHTALALSREAERAFGAAGQADGRLRAGVVAAEAEMALGHAAQAETRLCALLETARKLQLLPLQVRCLTDQGLVALALGAERHAARAFAEAIDVLEEQCRAVAADELHRAFRADQLRPYQELLRLALREPAASGPAHGGNVLQQLDRFRARSLDARLSQAVEPEHDPATEDQRARLNWLYRRQRRLQDEGEASPSLDELLQRTELELLERVRRQRLLRGRAPAARDDGLDLGVLRSLLGKGDALVEWGTLDDELFACVVTRTATTVQRRLASWRDVTEALRSARFQLESLRDGGAPVARHLVQLTRRAQARLGRLHDLVWAPLEPLLEGCSRVLVVPQGPLGTLPFAALHDGQRSLGERIQFAVASSARLAQRGLLRPPVPPRTVLAIGESSRLTHAAAEVRFVGSLFDDSRTCVDAEATLAALRQGAPQADVLHVACHAAFRADNPMFSTLQLHDGPCTAEVAETLKLRPCIVVLSGCDTGLAGHDEGDDRVGFVRAFLVAGASRVLASLWPVDDAVTTEFMGLFYSALCGGETPAAALQCAQAGLRRSHPHPFHWAAFTLHGGW